MPISSFFIAGVGGIGSYLAKSLALESLSNNKIKEINLLDCDRFDKTNYFDLSIDKSLLIGLPKVTVIEKALKNINSNLAINTFDKELTLQYLEELSEELPNTIFIDCRDTLDFYEKFHYKINSDGEHFNITINKFRTLPRKTYTIKNNSYINVNVDINNRILFSIIAKNIITNPKFECCDGRFYLNINNILGGLVQWTE